MADDFQEKINSVLSDPDMMKNISSLAKSLGVSEADGLAKGDNDDFSVNIQNILSGVDMNSDSRINLLNALRPYMKQSRSKYVDTAIRILKLTKISSVISRENL